MLGHCFRKCVSDLPLNLQVFSSNLVVCSGARPRLSRPSPHNRLLNPTGHILHPKGLLSWALMSGEWGPSQSSGAYLVSWPLIFPFVHLLTILLLRLEWLLSRNTSLHLLKNDFYVRHHSKSLPWVRARAAVVPTGWKLEVGGIVGGGACWN